MMRRAARIMGWVMVAGTGMLALALVLYAVVPPVSTLMAWRWLRGAPVTRIYVPIERIDRSLVVTVVAAEDSLFCQHHGVDWADLREVIEEADEDGPTRGASTLTMQVVKNLFLWPGRSYVRKALEIPLALVIDLVWSKRRILEIYLNIAEWGPSGQFGVEAGARQAFGKGAGRLGAQEAGLLAAVLPNPHVRSARRPGPRVQRLAATLAQRAAGSPQVAACVFDR